MARYSVEVIYIQEIHNKMVDALLQAPTCEHIFIEQVEEHSNSVIASMQATKQKLMEIKTAQDNDSLQLSDIQLFEWMTFNYAIQPLLKP